MKHTQTGEQEMSKRNGARILKVCVRCLVVFLFLWMQILFTQRVQSLSVLLKVTDDVSFLEATTNSSQKLQACFMANFVLGSAESRLDQHLQACMKERCFPHLILGSALRSGFF